MNLNNFYLKSPAFIQSLMISVYNVLAYRKRYGGRYKEFRNIFLKNRSLTYVELKKIQDNKLSKFLEYSIENSDFYSNVIKDKTNPKLENFPIVNKEVFRKNIDQVLTIKPKDGIISKTGGTTGKSLTVYYTYEDMQERFALLDDFRSRFGYKLGQKTAWFSGKSLITKSDLKKNVFWKMDYLNKVRYYSTFHIKSDNMEYYLKDLIKFQPLYMVGFPSSMVDIAKYGNKHKIDFPKGVKAIFPTAETVTIETRKILSKYFKTDVYDQYASSEGAPFIFECKNHNLHMELQSGVFEVLDDEDNPSDYGRLILTSFTTHGTPLIRYDIGDVLKLTKERCSCGNNNPLVESIEGRIDDYIYSPQNGKINLGNVSNTLKGTKGIKRFQVIQNELNKILIQIEIDRNNYDKNDELILLKNWRERVGNGMIIDIKIVDNIQHESSGKFRIVKNSIKHLLE